MNPSNQPEELITGERIGGDRYPKSDWEYEVLNGDTNLSYPDWLIHKAEADGRVIASTVDHFAEWVGEWCERWEAEQRANGVESDDERARRMR